MSAMNVHGAIRIGMISSALRLTCIVGVMSLATLASCGGQSSDSDGSAGPDEKFGHFTRAERYYLSYEIPFYAEGQTKRLEVLRPLFDANDAFAIRRYAEAYLNQMGFPRDPHKAFELYSRAAKMGDAISMHMIGAMHYSGRGTPQNYDQALAWYQKSFDLIQYAPAARGLYKYYWEGRGPGSLKENRSIAEEWKPKLRLAEKEENKNDGVKILSLWENHALNKDTIKAQGVLSRYHDADFEAIKSRTTGQERDAENLTKLGNILLGTDAYWKNTIYQREIFNPEDGVKLLKEAYEIETRPKERHALAKTIERAYGSSGPKEIRSATNAQYWRSQSD